MRVLVADDDPVSRLMLQAAVEDLGHECLGASDGDEAWRLFRQAVPEVLVTDRVMPGVDGLELCRRVRSEPAITYTYVILVTSLDDRQEILHGMEAGADDYLTKP
ncbi:MAG: response regulator, partial [Actinobacteria bacterium]|nr:response regulator [Actinomycetota bacterium]